MKKRIKIVLVILFSIIFTLFCFQYFVSGELNFCRLSNIFSFWNENTYDDFIYDEKFISENKSINSLPANAIGTSVHTYRLELEDVPEKIISFHLSLDSSKTNSNQVMVTFYTKDKTFSYDQDDFYINKDSDKIILVQQSNVEKIVVETVFEQYGATDLVNPEILSLNQIDINEDNDIEKLKTNLFLDFFISILITVLFFILFFILFKTNIDKKILNIHWNLENVFLIMGILIGVLFSVLFPLYQIPDELTHINMIYDEWNIDMQFQDISGSYGDTVRIIRNYDEKVDIDKYFDFSKKMKFINPINIPSVTLVKHFPQAIGLIFSSILELPIIVGITISEVLAALFYVYVCYFALRLLPLKKEVMMIIMLLPMCIQQMGSFSYDSVLLPICFLFISYVLHLKFVKEKIKLFDIGKLVILLGIIALIKVPYVLLGGLIILLPLSKLNLDFKFIKIDIDFCKKYKFLIFICLFFIFVLGMFVGIKLLKTISYGRILLGAVKANIATINLILNTLLIYGKQCLIELTGSFGWLDTPVSILFTIFVLGSILLVTFFNFKYKKKSNEVLKRPFKIWEVIYLLFLAIVMSFIIILSMFEWTLYATGVPNHSNLSVTEYANLIKNSIPVIGGVQGRYFIPIIPLFVLPIFSNLITKIISKMNYKFYLLVYYIILICYMLYVILNRYWIW